MLVTVTPDDTSGLPQGNDKIRGTLSTAEISVPQKKKKNFNPRNFRGRVAALIHGLPMN